VIVRDLQTHAADEATARSISSRSSIRHPDRRRRARDRAPIIRRYDEVTGLGSRTRLGQVFLNLIVNAAQAIEGQAASNRIEIGSATLARVGRRGHRHRIRNRPETSSGSSIRSSPRRWVGGPAGAIDLARHRPPRWPADRGEHAGVGNQMTVGAHATAAPR
jgi:hypothetical protein